MPTRRKSSLVTYEKISPNKATPRSKTIRRLTPHCVAGNLSMESTLGLSAFRSGGGASTSYAIGSDGRCGLGVEETNRPWTSSSSVNDNEAITFEIANDGGAPDWHMSDAAINAFLDQAVETCRFYGFKKVHYEIKPASIGQTGVENWIKTWAKPDEMIITLHNWYANKACPGPYFMRQLPWLVAEMNKRLQNEGWIPEKFIGEGETETTIDSGSTLKQGVIGDQVKHLQQKLNTHGATPVLTVDGHFGSATTMAVKAFQLDKKLVVDGVVGQATWAKLNEKPSIVISQEEFTVSYMIRIKVTALNVRSGPGTNYDIVKTLVNDKNVYTIIEEQIGPGATKWGKLKSNLGWISLDHTSKV